VDGKGIEFGKGSRVDQELDARASVGTIYWEGAVRAFNGATEVGRGYLELTGYWQPMKL